jgi:hypothetical protein
MRSVSDDDYDCDDNECRDQRKSAIKCFRSGLCGSVGRRHDLTSAPVVRQRTKERDTPATLAKQILSMLRAGVELLQHPIFVTTIAFYCLGEKGIGTWIRTPGARNPQQRIEIIEPFRYGEIITMTVTTVDKFTQRGKPYLQMLLDFRNERGVLKARWWCSLILPETRADVARFANA